MTASVNLKKMQVTVDIVAMVSLIKNNVVPAVSFFFANITGETLAALGQTEVEIWR